MGMDGKPGRSGGNVQPPQRRTLDELGERNLSINLRLGCASKEENPEKLLSKVKKRERTSKAGCFFRIKKEVAENAEKERGKQ